jgi:hypothetical protein
MFVGSKNTKTCEHFDRTQTNKIELKSWPL